MEKPPNKGHEGNTTALLGHTVAKLTPYRGAVEGVSFT